MDKYLRRSGLPVGRLYQAITRKDKGTGNSMPRVYPPQSDFLSRNSSLLFQLIESAHEVFKQWSLIDVVYVYVTDNSLLIDDKQCPFRNAVGP